jgi:hypothetical protein
MSFGQYSNEPKPDKPAFPERKKRLKYVFDDPTHVWAHPLTKDGSGFEQDNARNQNANIYFKTSADGTRVLYSYRDSYPIACLFTHKKKTVVLLRSGKPYSVTTAKHFGMARNASHHIEPRFSVPEVINYTGKPEPATHEANLADYVERINEQIEAFGKARGSYRIDQALESATNLDTEARAYAKFFNLKLPKLPKLPVLDAEKMRTIRERENAAATKREAKRKAEQAAYEAKHAAEVKAWEDAGGCPHSNPSTLRPLHGYYDRYRCEEQARRDEWEANKPALIAAWRNGVGQSNSLQFGYTDYALLRVKLDENTGLHNVETSQGVSVPVTGRSGAARLLAFLQGCKERGQTHKANGHTEHIGNFTVFSFGPQTRPAGSPQSPLEDDPWVLVAGCHRILWSEVESIADAVRTANDADASIVPQTNDTENINA